MGPAQVSGTFRTQKSQHSTRSHGNKKTQDEESEDPALSTSRSFDNCVTHSFIHSFNHVLQILLISMGKTDMPLGESSLNKAY